MKSHLHLNRVLGKLQCSLCTIKIKMSLETVVAVHIEDKQLLEGSESTFQFYRSLPKPCSQGTAVMCRADTESYPRASLWRALNLNQLLVEHFFTALKIHKKRWTENPLIDLNVLCIFNGEFAIPMDHATIHLANIAFGLYVCQLYVCQNDYLRPTCSLRKRKAK